jgi:hypothetical protein
MSKMRTLPLELQLLQDPSLIHALLQPFKQIPNTEIEANVQILIAMAVVQEVIVKEERIDVAALQVRTQAVDLTNEDHPVVVTTGTILLLIIITATVAIGPSQNFLDTPPVVMPTVVASPQLTSHLYLNLLPLLHYYQNPPCLHQLVSQ